MSCPGRSHIVPDPRLCPLSIVYRATAHKQDVMSYMYVCMNVYGLCVRTFVFGMIYASFSYLVYLLGDVGWAQRERLLLPELPAPVILYHKLPSPTLDLFQLQIIHIHVPAQCDPSVPEPNHLAFVCRCHGFPRSSDAASASQSVEKHQPPRVFLVFLIGTNSPAD